MYTETMGTVKFSSLRTQASGWSNVRLHLIRGIAYTCGNISRLVFSSTELPSKHSKLAGLLEYSMQTSEDYQRSSIKLLLTFRETTSPLNCVEL